jgi:hypothetical protein
VTKYLLFRVSGRNWREFGFSDYPLLSVIVSFSVFGLLLTPYWPFALLCVSSHFFHIFLTHNIPRYHAVEFPVLVFSAIFLLWLFWHHYLRFVNLFGRKSIREKKWLSRLDFKRKLLPVGVYPFQELVGAISTSAEGYRFRDGFAAGCVVIQSNDGCKKSENHVSF